MIQGILRSYAVIIKIATISIIQNVNRRTRPPFEFRTFLLPTSSPIASFGLVKNDHDVLAEASRQHIC
jgi:hypothetical protein